MTFVEKSRLGYFHTSRKGSTRGKDGEEEEAKLKGRGGWILSWQKKNLDFGKSEKQKDDELSRAETTEEDANGSHSDCNRQVSTKDKGKEENNDKEQDNDKKEDNDKGIEKCFARQEEMPFYIFLEVNLSIEPPGSKTTSFYFL